MDAIYLTIGRTVVLAVVVIVIVVVAIFLWLVVTWIWFDIIPSMLRAWRRARQDKTRRPKVQPPEDT